MTTDRAARILCLSGCAAESDLPNPEFRVETAEDFAGARQRLLDAARDGDAYALIMARLETPADEAALAKLSAEAPTLRFLLETPAEACALPSFLSARQAVCLAPPVSPATRRALARHLTCLWADDERRREAARAAEPLADADAHGLDADRQRLEMLYLIIEKLHAGSSLREGFLTSLAEMARFLGATTASLMLVENGDRLLVHEALGPNRERIVGKRFGLGESRIAKRALEEGAPLLITDMRDDDQFGETEGEMRFRSRSILSVPVVAKAGPVAVLNFGGGESDVTFTSRDRELVVTLARQVAAALEKNALLDQLRTTVSGSIRALAHAIEAKDPYTRGHSDRVTRYSILTALEMGMSPADVELLKQAAILHDIGKIGIPGDVLNKQGKLDNVEFRVIKRHPEIGIDIVRQIGAMDATLPIIHAHHERLDGKGYPNGLVGEAIPIGARILAVADAYDAMTSDRPYRPGMSIADAAAEIERCIGTQFDPDVARAFLRNVEDWSHQESDEDLFFSMI